MRPIGNFLPPEPEGPPKAQAQAEPAAPAPRRRILYHPRRKVISGVVATAAVGPGAEMTGNITNGVVAVRAGPPAVTVRMTSRYF